MLGTHYAIVYTGTKGRVEDTKKRGGSGQKAAAKAWGDHNTGSKSQSSFNLDNGGKGKEWLYRYVVS